MVEIDILQYRACATVETLLDRAFGGDRHRRVAYRLRDGAVPIVALSFVAYADTDRLHTMTEEAEEQKTHGETQEKLMNIPQTLLGSIQCWPVAHIGAARITPLIMVGPVAVHPAYHGAQIGHRLVQHMLTAAEQCADGALMMIGDPEYYSRFFDFSAHWTQAWRIEGHEESRRLLARAIGTHSPPISQGWIAPRGAQQGMVACG